MYKKILVTLDGSPLSEAILPEVARLMEGTGMRAVLYRLAKTPKVETPPEPVAAGEELWRRGSQPAQAPSETLDQKISQVKDEIDWYLRTHAGPLLEKGIELDYVVETGDEDPAEAITHYAQIAAVDMIAMATHGRTGLVRLVAGSVAEKVVASGVKPVFLVRPEVRPE